MVFDDKIPLWLDLTGNLYSEYFDIAEFIFDVILTQQNGDSPGGHLTFQIS